MCALVTGVQTCALPICAVNSHQPVIHGHCRDHGRQILRVSSRAKRGARVKSESARDSANASGLKIGFGESIADWRRFAPDTLGKGVVRGLAGTVPRLADRESVV